MTKYLTDKAHVCIWGITGYSGDYGGKSVLANWWMTNLVNKGVCDLGIFFNPKADSFVNGDTVNDVYELADRIRMGSNMFDFRPASTTGEDEHAELMDFLNHYPGSKIVVHDEASDYDDQGGSLHWAVKRGGNEAEMKSIVLSQSPVDLETAIRKQCVYRIWIGPVGNDEIHYFRQMDAEDVFHQIEGQEAYHWTVFDIGGELVAKNQPVDASMG